VHAAAARSGSKLHCRRQRLSAAAQPAPGDEVVLLLVGCQLRRRCGRGRIGDLDLDAGITGAGSDGATADDADGTSADAASAAAAAVTLAPKLSKQDASSCRNLALISSVTRSVAADEKKETEALADNHPAYRVLMQVEGGRVPYLKGEGWREAERPSLQLWRPVRLGASEEPAQRALKRAVF